MSVLRGRHALVPFAYSRQVSLVAEVAASFVFDNSAFSKWKSGITVNWQDYYRFVDDWCRHPGFDWALIPDVIDGDEAANDQLLEAWPFSHALCPSGVPQCKLHGLRMLDPDILKVFPFSSGDSTNVAVNIGPDKRWLGTYAPMTKTARAIQIADRMEFHQAAQTWESLL